MPASMTQLFDQIHKVPQIPEVVRAIINQLNDPRAEILDLAKNVEKEQMLAMKILRLVNSAHFGLSRKVASIDQATVMLGTNQLKTLVIASGIVGSMPKVDNFDIKRFWANTFRTAAYAKWLAEKTQESADVAYTAGLICNLGRILLQIATPNEANEIEQHVRAGNISRSEIENKRLGFTTQAVCAELCRRWKFADELIAAVEYSHNPLAYEDAPGLSSIICLARLISDGVDKETDKQDILASLPSDVVQHAGLSEMSSAQFDDLWLLESDLGDLVE